MELTQALLTMTKAAESRRIARKQLKEAVAAVVAAVVENARTGDEVYISNYGKVEVIRPWYPGKQGPGWTTQYHRADEKTLLGPGGILRDVAEDWHDGHNTQLAIATFYRDREDCGFENCDMRLADSAALAEFCANAAAIIAAFAALYAEQAVRAAAAADAVAKLEVR